MQVTTERKKELFAKFGKGPEDTGSTEGQIALFTERIDYITQHLRKAKKDYASELSLVKLVGKRRALLDYLAKQDIMKYRSLIKELGIRK
jgi:small subunit ribosomal protein S15